ncbi:MAG: ComF family protein [Clostridia bacterium]|nr:ComF family protein [Clostridia bacterium]
MAWLKRPAQGLVDLIYPKKTMCMGCGTQAGFERDWLCEDCRVELAQRWYGAGQPPRGGLIDGAAFGYRYGGPVSGMVHNLKYRSAWQLAGPMARAMVSALSGLQPLQIDGVVPVPMHKKRLRERGRNHSALLAEQVAALMALPQIDALERVRDTAQQALLSDAERQSNLENAFRLVRDVAGMRLLLVDDVCTTGATANACAAALREGGAASVVLLCYAEARAET